MSSRRKDSRHRHNCDCRCCRKGHTRSESSSESHSESSSESHSEFRPELDQPNADVAQIANQFSLTDQESDELIFIKDSCNITVHSTDTQAAVSLQVGLQLAIALVIRITIGDTERGQNVVQDLLQHFDSEQLNKQKICIENSKDINVTTTDTDVSVNIQLLLQVLVALVAKLDVL